MGKRRLIVTVLASAIAIAAALGFPWRRSASTSPAVAVIKAEPTRIPARWNPVASSCISDPRTMEDRLMEEVMQNRSPAEVADLLKKLYSENPDGLFNALLTMGRESLATRQRLLPLLAEALILWPDAEGRYVFPVADAYGEMDECAAAEWAATFLVSTGRSDLAASSLLGRLCEVSEDRAFSLIASLPPAARKDAMNSVAYHIAIGDLNHLMTVCSGFDPQGISTFSKQLFERLGMERLNETAAWLQTTPGAARIPGAISSISRAIVINDGPEKAVAWADSLPDVNAEAQAITTIYGEWAKESPENAIKNILAVYDGAPQLMADVFNGAAGHHGSGALAQWDAARGLVNSSARAYAIAALIEPMLMTAGPAETRSKIASLPSNSLERTAAELMMQAAYKNPATVGQIETRFGVSP
jgi:hypothetical protein